MKLRLTFLLGLALAAVAARAAEVNVFAAASLTDALKEIAKAYEPASGDHLRFNFGASSTLAVQIKQGAPADVFFSADEAKMNDLAKGGFIATDTRKTLLANTLTIVVNREGGPKVTGPADLADPAVGRIALGEPHTVPVGVYGKQWLEKIGLWAKIADRIVPTENVRSSLAAVESGNVGAGIVYKTDALISKKVKIAYELPAAEGPAIAYPVAVLKDSRQAEAARKFAAYLAGPEAKAVFAKYGFLPAP